MPPTATQVLLAEHKTIRAVLNPAFEAAGELASIGQRAFAASLPALRALADLMEGDLALHAAKEDQILFPAIEGTIGSIGGPTEVMRDEHRRIHVGGEAFRTALAGLPEHPSADSLQTMAAGLLELGQLISAHFDKEERALFPMADALLTPQESEAIGERLLAFTG